MVLSRLEFIISRIVVYQWKCQANNVLGAPYIVSQIYIDPLYKGQGFLIWGIWGLFIYQLVEMAMLILKQSI